MTTTITKTTTSRRFVTIGGLRYTVIGVACGRLLVRRATEQKWIEREKIAHCLFVDPQYFASAGA